MARSVAKGGSTPARLRAWMVATAVVAVLFGVLSATGVDRRASSLRVADEASQQLIAVQDVQVRLVHADAIARENYLRGGIEDGARLVMRMGRGGIGPRWIADHVDFIDGVQFRDVQTAGPFAWWEHTHRVEPDGAEACWLDDHIEYVLPGGAAGALLGGGFTRAKLRRMFDYRHRVTAGDVAAHARIRGQQAMRILVTGSSGLVGSALVPYLTTGGHEVVRLVRTGRKRAGTITWDPAAGKLDRAFLEGFDAVVHLAGESITGRWTTDRKARIHDSRVDGTHLLVEALGALQRPPKVLVAASAIGFYGHRGRDVVAEDSAPGAGFLADVCREWEAEAQVAVAHGLRVVSLRLGIVLSAAGGALAAMLTPFKLGAGGAEHDAEA